MLYMSTTLPKYSASPNGTSQKFSCENNWKNNKATAIVDAYKTSDKKFSEESYHEKHKTFTENSIWNNKYSDERGLLKFGAQAKPIKLQAELSQIGLKIQAEPIQADPIMPSDDYRKR
ncbi:hypothetical protein HELRODRAFT_179066 [Helobdella robusta]|uniref:Uncharacterized protein n=1 Tax=Helobdella robusta TaxID=6412 RepID=T1FE49_HELRO|nr:hypothetical protein HELRODRAFT_179066 [Helobdella robusta]ESN95612.1 hypothetical protein HELRODRAFT_179066 [Helobdella robusta]